MSSSIVSYQHKTLLSFSQRCEETGEDFDLVKLRELGADEVERWERRKKKKNPDMGFSGNRVFHELALII